MSLIQVSSSQLAFKNQDIGQGAFNTGFRFSNFFNNVLEIPANSEIALHSAQFDMESTSGVDTTFISTDNDLNVPDVRVIFSNKSGDFTEQNNDFMLRGPNNILQAVPTAAAHQPLINYITRKKYPTMEAFWLAYEDTFNTEPRPIFQYKMNNTGTFVSGLTVGYTAPLGVETETFTATPNTQDTSGSNNRRLTSNAHTDGGGCGFTSPSLLYDEPASQYNLCTLTDQVGITAEYDSVIKASGGKQRQSQATWNTQFEGITNVGGIVSVRSFECISLNLQTGNPNQGQGRRHQYTLGLKKWGVITPSATGDIQRTRGIAELANAGDSQSHYDIAQEARLRWGATVPPLAATLDQYYYSAAVLSSGAGGLSWTRDMVADVFWAIHPRVKSIGGFETGGTKVAANGWSRDMVVSLWKYECGKGTGIEWADWSGFGRIVCVATGDAVVSDKWNVNYSGMLDPTNAAFPGSAAPAGNNHVLQDQVGGLGGGIGLGFQVIGNQVVPLVQGAALDYAKTQTGYDAALLADVFVPISDVCFPLQLCGSINGYGDWIKQIRVNPAGAFASPGLNYQSPVRDFGDKYEDFFDYVRAGQICPASQYNQVFLDQTCEVTYPNDSNVLTPQSITPFTFYDALIPQGGGINSLNVSPFIAIGNEPLLDVKPAQGATYANNANIADLIHWDPAIAPTNVLSLVPDITFSESKGSYEIQATGVSPFLLGLYIKLKNLPNRSTFGSLNQADTEKLISVINRYDERQSSSGDKTMYAYNEYDKLYISLNNPAPIFLSKLDFEIVDRFGNPVSALDQTTLVLHLRPAEYRDFYKR